MTITQEAVAGVEHRATKQHESGPISLYVWEKFLPSREGNFEGTVLLIHGSSMASRPSFDLDVPGHEGEYSLMDFLAREGFDVWCFDCEGYGLSDKTRPSKFYIADGAADAAAVIDLIRETRGAQQVMAYGISSGAIRAAMLAEQRPDLVNRLILDAFVWTGEGSPTLAERRKRLPEFMANDRRPIDAAFVRSIFSRDHPGTADDEVIEAFASAITKLDDSIPNGTYVDMCSNLPLVDPAKITSPVMITRGQYDGIAGFDDILAFFKALPNSDKHLTVLAGSAHSSIHEKNYRTLFHIIASYFHQPEPVYRG